MNDAHHARFFSDRQWHGSVRIGRIKTHTAIFDAYAVFVNDVRIMAERMDAVLDHPEHVRLIEGGLLAGYKMPNVGSVRARNEIIKNLLRGTDIMKDATRKGDMVEIPARTALRLYMIADYAQRMIDGVVGQINGSQYMPWIATLRDAGAPYAGPTSLQEVFNVWGSLTNSIVKQQHYAPAQAARLPQNWLKLVS